MTIDNQAMGEVLRSDGRWGLRYERRLTHRPEKVWRALTESAHLRHWLPCDIVGERREGAPLELPFWPAQVAKYGIEEPALHGEIRTWDPPRRFVWTWDGDLLDWELTGAGDGTLLTFTTWFGEDDAATAAGAGAGYHVCLDHLAELLDTGAVAPLVDADVAVWKSRYDLATAQAAGDPT